MLWIDHLRMRLCHGNRIVMADNKNSAISCFCTLAETVTVTHGWNKDAWEHVGDILHRDGSEP